MTRRYSSTRQIRKQLIGRPLEPIEERVMNMLASGLTPSEIAVELHYNINTINNRLTMIRDKLEAKTTVQAMYLWAASQPRFHRLVRQIQGECYEP